ncbi:HD domain-containing protein [Caldinitratiruptor microaerophilus]|uniref:HDIG domain-containing protein n=1 Tax=Caldinitratiruptor microaerophilus TaxID=671077 RepID=A0AA35CLD8_9FIRM|nr:HD domain-containing protein [Caldinitratiruptor microaerophilus]BDG61352.1 HDIG domain-containing protein [Caldinitratiruptor microaerophilus]
MPLPSRDEAMALLHEWVQDPRLLKHLYGVEACMRAYARKYGGDEDLWGLTGLLHDLDYERYPTLEVHPRKAAEVLREKGYPDELVYAVLAHANYLQDQYPRRSLMDKALYACDELSNFVIAVALVRPNRSIHEVDVQAVRKKMKDKRFAAGVNREDVIGGAAELGLDLDEHIAFVIEALKPVAEQLGIAGTGSAVPAEAAE